MNLRGGTSAKELGDDLVVPYLEKPSGCAAANNIQVTPMYQVEIYPHFDLMYDL